MRRQAIERMLPAAFQRAATANSPLWSLLWVMEDLHAPDEAILDSVDELFVPYRTRERFVAYLASWLALDHLLPPPGGSTDDVDIPLGRLRNLVAEGAALAQWRGTPTGLRRTLEIATGVTGFVLEEPADRPFHVVVHVPPAAADQIPLVRRVVATEKPAATTSDIVVEQISKERNP